MLCKTVKPLKEVKPLKAILVSALLLFFLLLSTTFISCAGGAGSPASGGSAEATSLCVQLPGTVERAATQYQKVDSNFQTFTVTIDSSSYKATKSCGAGETLKFENIPVGHYDVVAFAKRADGNVTAKGTASVDIEADVTKTVKITLNRLKYATVTFYNGEDVYATQEITEGYTAKKPADPTDPSGDGREFSFWGISSESTSGFDFNASISDDQSLYAVYGLATYNITFDYNGYTQGGNSTSSIPVTEGTVPSAPTLGTRTNYTFKGWATSDDATEDDVLDSIPEATESVTYYAVWEPDEYDITYVLPDGLTGVTIAENDSSGKPYNKYTYNSSSTTGRRYLPNGTDISGTTMSFDGWYTDADYTTAATYVPEGSNEDKTYYAKFSRSITVYLEKFESSWGATLATDVTAVYGKTITAPTEVASASKAGYTLSGWKTGPDGEEISFVFGTTVYSGTGAIWGEWTEGSVTNFNGTLAEFSALDFTIDGTGTAECPCPVTITGVTGSSDFNTIKSKLNSYTTPSSTPGVYCTLDLSGCNFTVIPRSAFTCSSSIGNRGIMGITLPDTVTTIEYGAFYDTNITSITLPSSLQSIGEHAFRYSELTSVTIPASTTTISISAFQESSNLETFTATGTWTLYDGDGNAVVSGITLNAQKMKDPGTVLSGYDDSTHREYYYQKD